jgi:tetratricopeptide (TPR) repeat protein
MDQPKLAPDDIFCAAIELASPAERAAYLDQVCGDDVETRRRVERLLDAHFQAGSFLAARPAAVTEMADLPAVSSGTAIGPYKLLQLIGEGGMGAVWMAEQTQPLQRKVALKIIKAGMDSRQVLARFEAERQALALMDHPNIAKVLDGGATAAGRPFFVMELVKGQPITQYCDGQRLTPRQRLELFVSVCQAIQHAHQKGIIHRDIKPSNVLVAPYDGRPVVKVIDFGVAKATGQRLTEKTLFTELGAVVGTLEYMSPEQAALNNQDIDTRSDIYALGVLLYELLTGSTPLPRQRLKQAAFGEMLRIIREEEPPKPSTRLSTTEELPSVAANRGLEPKKLSGLVRGELDWIVMKALEKDRNRRYETANGFAIDVQRYLADELVQACPPSAWYQFRKFARRNRTGLAVAAMVLFFITLVGAGAGWIIRDRAARQARAANDLELALDRVDLFQKDGKRPEAQAALDHAELLADRAAADPARDARLAVLKERLAADARDQEFIARFDSIRLLAQSRVDVEAGRFTQGAAFPEIRDALKRYGMDIGVLAPAQAAARVQGRPEPVRRELIAALVECLRRAPRGDSLARQWLLDTLAAADNDGWRVRVRKADIDHDTKVMEQLGREVDVHTQPPSFLLSLANALPAQMSASQLELLRRIQRAYPADLWANHELAFRLASNGQPAEAVRYYTAALALRPDSAGIYLNRGMAYHDAQELDAAIADSRAAIRLRKDYADAHNNLGLALLKKGQLEEAIAAYREAIRLKKDNARAHCMLGNALRELGQLDEAIAAWREAIRLKKDYAEAHNNLGDALRAKGQLDEALAACREAVRLSKDIAEAHNNLGNALGAKGQLDEAIAAYREAIRLKKDFAVAHCNLGRALGAKGQLDEALAACREAIRLKKDYAEAHCNLGLALRDKGQFTEALAALQTGHMLGSQKAGWRNPSAAWVVQVEQLIELNKGIEVDPKNVGAWTQRAFCYERIQQWDKAIANYTKVIELSPNDTQLHNNLAWKLATHPNPKGREPRRAVQWAQKAVELAPQKGDYWNTLGVANYRAGDWKAAIAALEKSMELRKGGDGFDWFFLAMAHEKLGDHQKARTWYDKAVGWVTNHQPENEELRRFRAEATELLRMGEKGK